MADRWSYFEITGILNEKGYKDVETLWYKVVGKDLNHGLKQLVDDASAWEMVDIARCEGRVHLYVLHSVSVLQVVHFIEPGVENGSQGIEGNGGNDQNDEKETPVAEGNAGDE